MDIRGFLFGYRKNASLEILPGDSILIRPRDLKFTLIELYFEWNLSLEDVCSRLKITSR